jgi:hypothetical protein
VIAKLTFSPGQVLMIAVLILLFTLVAIWGLFQGEHDRVQRAKERQLRREIRRQP